MTRSLPRSTCTTKPRHARGPAGRSKLPKALYEHALRCIGLPPTVPGFSSAPLLTQQNLADLLGVGRTTVINWILAGKLTPVLVEQYPPRKLFSLEQILVIARNAIRERRAPALLVKGMPGRPSAIKPTCPFACPAR